MIDLADIPRDELLLAQLLCAKLVFRLRGMLSVGLGSLQFSSPVQFLDGRDRPIMTIVEVLSFTGMKPGSESAKDFGERLDRVADLCARFFDHLQRLVKWRNMSIKEVQQGMTGLASVYAELLAITQEFLVALGVPTDHSQIQAQGRELIECVGITLTKAMSAPA
jgi:hypothetical protein